MSESDPIVPTRGRNGSAAKQAGFHAPSDTPTPPSAEFIAWGCPKCGFVNGGQAILCHGCGWDSAR